MQATWKTGHAPPDTAEPENLQTRPQPEGIPLVLPNIAAARAGLYSHSQAFYTSAQGQEASVIHNLSSGVSRFVSYQGMPGSLRDRVLH